MTHSTRTARALAGIAALLPGPIAALPQPEIEAMVARVSEPDVTGSVTDLVAFGTRHSSTTGCEDASVYLLDRLGATGLPARRDDFMWGARTLHNVVARHVGLVRPDEIYLVLAHYDSTSSNPAVSAPGADDNASGVAAVLEIARILSQERFEASVEFLLTGGEEQGLLGSRVDVAQRIASGEGLAGVINFDMIGYWPTGWGRDLDVNGTPASASLVAAYAQAAADYVPSMPVDARQDWGVCGDDQVSYDDRGFPSIIVMDCYEAHLGLDGETTPHYHAPSDTIDTLDFFRIAEVTRATTGAMAALAVPITRALLRNDEMTGPGFAGAALRPGDDSGGDLTRIDPAGFGTTSRYNPASSVILSGEGEPAGEGMRGTFVFYETDRADAVRVRKADADSDGAMDVVVEF